MQRTSDGVVVDVFILVEEHVNLAHADGKIRVIELVRNIPAQRAELTPLLHQRVEKAHTKQKFAEWLQETIVSISKETTKNKKNATHLFLLASCEERRVRNGVKHVRARDVGFEALGRLIGQLNARLQHSYREMRRRVARQPQTEIRVCFVWVELFAQPL